jgi:nitrate reductase gamma subunit
MSLSAFWYLNVKLHLGFDLVIYLNEQGLLVSNSLWVHVVFFVGVMGWIATVAVLGSWVVVLGITTYFNRKSRQRVVRDTFMKDSRDSFFKRMCFRVTFKE